MFDFNAVAEYLAKGRLILLKVTCWHLLSVIYVLILLTYVTQLLYMCIYISSYWWAVAGVEFSKLKIYDQCY